MLWHRSHEMDAFRNLWQPTQATMETSFSCQRVSRSCPALRKQRIGCENLGSGGVGIEISPRPDSDDNELLLRSLAPIRDGRRVPIGFELGDPELLPGLRIESPEAMIVRASDEDQAACRGNRPSYSKPGTPVLGIPFASSASTTPRGTFQAISPVFKSTAFKSPQGGRWHG
jgi:hypothetical protein